MRARPGSTNRRAGTPVVGNTDAVYLTISTTHRPATDLGYLLHKHPDRVQQFTQSFGVATVFYPQATDERCTAALLLEIDPVRLARGRARNLPDFSLGQYVNDRSYAASSLFAVTLAEVFSTARIGRCASHQDLADSPIPLQIRIPVLPCRGGPAIAHRIFEPLGWQVVADPIALDEAFPQWGPSRYVDLTLTGTVRLADALTQLHVLLPVLDESKHYWQGPDEVDKLLRSGGDWLAGHPEAELITRRYLARTGYTRVALERLTELGDDSRTSDAVEQDAAPLTSEPLTTEPQTTARTPLNRQRHDAVLAELLDLGVSSVIDLGCGPGAFLERLVRTPSFTKVAGSDVSTGSLHQAARRLHLDTMTERQADRVELFQGALTYEDPRYAGFDAAVLMEVIEHVDPSRLPALESVVFGTASPGAVLVTTPNREYNVHYDDLTGMRHPDHRFEWDRDEFATWCARVAATHGYAVVIRGIGDPEAATGHPTQLGVFTRDA
ncbi:3' terminal RNA ribose 2'-O-methyltransferase Hen1 [Ornithinibacter aureus]|nr:3' terminal RNA ribose 2'-O-methyltransferase Hen1 [Ornithinibacter aureus]